MGGPISFVEIESYLNINGINKLEQRQEVAHLIRILDSAYIEFFREQNKST